MSAVLLLVFSLALCVNGLQNETASDMYVFAYSWTPEYCYGKTNFPGCIKPQEFWGTSFTMHGLWPQYSAGGYPHDCSTESFDRSIPRKVGWDDMTQYWPDVEYVEFSPKYDSFWEHEWTKHGTCSGLSQQDYFQSTINLIKSFGTPKSVTEAVGGEIAADQLRDDFGGPSYVALQCDNGEYLSGAYTCWEHDANGFPTLQRECSSEVIGEDTCTSDTVFVSSF